MLTVAKLIECVERHRATIWPVLDKIEYRPSGILPSEALIFCCLAQSQCVEEAIESGRRFGYSTDCFASVFPLGVVSVDSQSESHGDTDARLKKRHGSGVMLIKDDGAIRIPQLAACHAGHIAVLLDGPKGPAALDVVDKIIDKVVFAAIHDLSQRCETPGGSQPNASRAMARRLYPDVLFTDAPEITEAYGHLDERAWKGTYGSRSELTACGSTLGIFCGGHWRS